MPAKVRILLRAEEKISSEEISHDRLHALFFSCAGKLGEELHKSGMVKPFSLNFFARCDSKTLPLHSLKEPAQALIIEASFLDESLFPRFLSSFLLEGSQELRLGGHRLIKVRKPFVRERDISSYQSIVADSGTEDKLCLTFRSPTCFRKGKEDYLLPEPRLIFKGLIKKWQIFSDVKIDIDLREVIENGLAVYCFDIRTLRVPTSQVGWFIGFVGRLHLAVKDKREEVLRWINALAKFSEFAGVGKKTTMGFGSVKVCGMSQQS